MYTWWEWWDLDGYYISDQVMGFLMIIILLLYIDISYVDKIDVMWFSTIN